MKIILKAILTVCSSTK